MFCGCDEEDLATPRRKGDFHHDDEDGGQLAAAVDDGLEKNRMLPLPPPLPTAILLL